MKRWLVLAALVIAISAAATLVEYLPNVSSSTDGVRYPAPPKAGGPVPKVVIEGEPKIDFGPRAQHTEIAHDWVIWNKGEADLRLYQASTTCSCTVANFKGGESEITVKPNESTVLHMTFNTKEFSGEYHQHATIATTDPAHPSIELGARAEVYPALIFTPADRTIGFTAISNDTEHRARLLVSSSDRPDFKITKTVTSKPDKIEVSFEPLTADERKSLKIKGRGYRIDVVIKRGMALGPFRDEVIIETDHPKQPESRLLVYGKVVGPVMLMPEHLRMTRVSGKAGGQGAITLLVSGRRATKFEIVKKPAALEAAIEPTDPGDKEGKYRLTVNVPPGTAPSTIDDLIVLKSDHPQAEIVKVPVTLYISE